MVGKNRILHISIDQQINSQVDFKGDNLEEAIYCMLTTLGLEITITSEDEEIEVLDKPVKSDTFSALIQLVKNIWYRIKGGDDG